jgi:hypothetical protein
MSELRHVRFVPIADIPQRNRHVRFTPKSGHWRGTNLRPLRAISGRGAR